MNIKVLSMHYPDKQDAVGTAIGSILGMIKYFIVGVLTWSLVWETVAISGIGAVVGFVFTQVCKHVVTTKTWKAFKKKLRLW